MGKRKGTHGFGMTIGLGTSIMMCLAGLMIISKLMILEKIDEKTVRYGVLVLMALVAVAGGVVSAAISGKKLWLLLSMGCILTVLVWLGSLIVDGSYRNVLGIVVSTGLGTMLSCVLCLKKHSNSGRRKRGYR